MLKGTILAAMLLGLSVSTETPPIDDRFYQAGTAEVERVHPESRGGTMDTDRVVDRVKQSAVLREAAKGPRFFEYALASIIWHEMAHLVPDRTGVLILDGQRPEAGTASVGVSRQVLRRAGQGRELPDRDHGRAVDRAAGVAARGVLVSARGVADARAAHAGAHPRRRNE